MENEIRDIRHSFEEEMKNVTDAKTTEEMRIKYLGRKGLISGLMGKIPSVNEDERPSSGKDLNILKNTKILAIETSEELAIAQKIRNLR